MNEIKGKSVLVVGFGQEGKSVYQYLKNHNPDLEIGIADKKAINDKHQELKNVHIHSGLNYLQDVLDYDTIVRSPGVHPQLLKPAKKAGKQITTLSNIFFATSPGKIIGITGTKGKSTTASLIAHILGSKLSDVRLVGNIGNPALDYLDDSSSKTIFVMELSSQQLIDIHYSPSIAVLLPIVPEHLDFHGSFEEYIRAKSNIVRFQTENDYVVFNPSHKATQKIAKISKGKKVYFDNKTFKYVQNAFSFFQTIPSENVNAAMAVANLFEISDEQIAQAIQTFQPLPHRLEFVGEFKNIQFYNDSLATVPQATLHAISTLGPNLQTIILGGYDRRIDYANLAEFLSSSSIENFILFPTTGEKVWGLMENKKEKKKFDVNSMENAVRLAFEHTQKGKIVLLSPAASSFNLFKNFQDRGEQFIQFVTKFGSQ